MPEAARAVMFVHPVGAEEVPLVAKSATRATRTSPVTVPAGCAMLDRDVVPVFAVPAARKVMAIGYLYWMLTVQPVPGAAPPASVVCTLTAMPAEKAAPMSPKLKFAAPFAGTPISQSRVAPVVLTAAGVVAVLYKLKYVIAAFGFVKEYDSSFAGAATKLIFVVRP